MFAQLGKIQFSTLKTFTDYSDKGSATYAEHKLLDGKPLLQRTGSSLTELSISIYLHAGFCDPKAELKALKDARNDGEILPLLWGNGDIEGDFIIVDTDVSKEDAMPDGTVISYRVQLNLKEYAYTNRLQQEQTANRQNAKAVGDKKPVAKKVVNKPTCAQFVSKTIASIDNHGKAINKIVLEVASYVPTTKDKIRSHNNAISLLCGKLMEQGEIDRSCISAYPAIVQNAGFVRNNANIFNADLSTQQSRIPNDNSETQRRIANLKAAAQPLINQAITRK